MEKRATLIVRSEAQARRAERERDAVSHAIGRNADPAVRMTWEEFQSGEPCRGCGLPFSDRRGPYKATLLRTPKEALEHDAVDARYKAAHPDCRAIQWRMADSLRGHCAHCCGTGPPLSPEVARDVAHALASVRTLRNHPALDTWQVSMLCGHDTLVQRRAEEPWSGSIALCDKCPKEAQERGILKASLKSSAREQRTKLQNDALEAERAAEAAQKLARRALAKAKRLRKDAAP